MDPITHGIIGLATASLSGQSFSILNPIYLGSLIGSVAPDFDNIYRFLGDDYNYHKKHRGTSHSVVSLAVMSLAITAALNIAFGHIPFLTVLAFTFIGALSHTIMDILNSYGAKLFKTKKRLNILMLYDPFITLISIGMIIVADRGIGVKAALITASLLYITARVFMRYDAKRKINNLYSALNIVRMEVIPGMANFFTWRYIIHADKQDIVGDYNQITGRIKQLENLEKSEIHHEIFMNTKLGEYFSGFTPNIHVKVIKENDKVLELKAIDLRYTYKNKFLHHSTLAIDTEDSRIIKSIFHPYDIKNNVAV